MRTLQGALSARKTAEDTPPAKPPVYVATVTVEQLAAALFDVVAPLIGAQREAPEYRDDKQEAHRLGIGVHKLRELVAAGVVPCVHIGDRRRYLARDVDAAIKAHSQAGAK
ncbi:MAG: hypothetical protein RLZZ450_5264 [Pseudomonadota bacterium]